MEMTIQKIENENILKNHGFSKEAMDKIKNSLEPINKDSLIYDFYDSIAVISDINDDTLTYEDSTIISIIDCKYPCIIDYIEIH